jgi:hypothetical protein
VTVSPTSRGKNFSWVKSHEDSLNKKIPVRIKAEAGKYIVSVRFLLERDGNITDVTWLNDPGFEMCKKVVKAIKRKS